MAAAAAEITKKKDAVKMQFLPSLVLSTPDEYDNEFWQIGAASRAYSEWWNIKDGTPLQSLEKLAEVFHGRWLCLRSDLSVKQEMAPFLPWFIPG